MHRFFALLVLALTSSLALATDWTVCQRTAQPFADVREALTLAIENRGLVINYTSHIADMLARTGADIGASKQVFAQAEIIEFCSAKLSRQMMEADPHNIVLCPFAIAIYTLPGDDKHTWISWRRPQGSAATIVEPLLRDIADEAGR